jgi:uncharacterized RDD family membrane protein YckC
MQGQASHISPRRAAVTRLLFKSLYMTDTPIKYAGFWKRFLAFVIDFVVLMPLIFVGVYLSGKTQWYFALWLIPSAIIGLWFGVYLVNRYGGTPGKLLLKIRIRMLDGSPITKKAAFLRYSVIFVLSTSQSLIFAVAALGIPADAYFNPSFLERSKAILANVGTTYTLLDVALQLWVFGEFVVMLFNERKRAAHDYMAGTIVVDLGGHV